MESSIYSDRAITEEIVTIINGFIREFLQRGNCHVDLFVNASRKGNQYYKKLIGVVVMAAIKEVF